MEEISSTNTNGAFSALGITESAMPLSLKFIMGNINHIVKTQLTPDNYPMWKSQMLKLFRANDFDGFLDGTIPAPPKSLLSESGQQEPNPTYKAWRMIDQNLASAVCSTISSTILPYVINLETTSDIWSTIERRLQATCRSRIMQLKQELHNVSMNTQTLAQYLTQIKCIVDSLAAAEIQIDPEDIILYTLNGLPSSFQAFKTFIRNQLTPLSLDDFYSLLCSEEINIIKETKPASSATVLPESSQTALYAQRGRGRFSSSRSRGRWQPSSTRRGGIPPQSSRNSTLQCQICGKFGHSASHCWHRLNMQYIPQPSNLQQHYQQPNQMALQASSIDPSSHWLLDTGATNHLTSSNDNIQNSQTYQGNEQIYVGNGASIPIQTSGSGLLPTPFRPNNPQDPPPGPMH